MHTKTLKSDKITHILLDQYAGMKIEGELDFKLLEYLYYSGKFDKKTS